MKGCWRTQPGFLCCEKSQSDTNACLMDMEMTHISLQQCGQTMLKFNKNHKEILSFNLRLTSKLTFLLLYYSEKKHTVYGNSIMWVLGAVASSVSGEDLQWISAAWMSLSDFRPYFLSFLYLVIKRINWLIVTQPYNGIQLRNQRGQLKHTTFMHLKRNAQWNKTNKNENFRVIHSYKILQFWQKQLINASDRKQSSGCLKLGII